MHSMLRFVMNCVSVSHKIASSPRKSVAVLHRKTRTLYSDYKVIHVYAKH